MDKSIEDFEIGTTLRMGLCSRLRLATHKDSAVPCAIKVVKKSDVIRLQQVEHVISEKAILGQCKHPFIVQLMYTFQDKLHLYMVQEFAVGGELFAQLRNAGRFDTASSRFYSAHVILVFEYLHKHGIIYRNLKPENLLLGKEGYVKLTEFSLAKGPRYTFCGTHEYLAPEMLLNKGHGKSVDWWTLGVLAYETMVGQPPFVANEPMGIFRQILKGKLNFPQFIEQSARSLIQQLLVTDLTRRCGCLRGGAADVREHEFFQGFVAFEELLAKQLVAPLVPCVEGKCDTSNYDHYPDSIESQPVMPDHVTTNNLFATF